METSIVEFNRLWVMGHRPLIRGWINEEVMKSIKYIFLEKAEVCFQRCQPAGIPGKSPQVLLTPCILGDTTLSCYYIYSPMEKGLNCEKPVKSQTVIFSFRLKIVTMAFSELLQTDHAWGGEVPSPQFQTAWCQWTRNFLPSGWVFSYPEFQIKQN